MTAAQEPRWIGQPVRRREDLRLLTGQGRYLDDISVPGTKQVSFLRSPHAHARITRIDVSRALKVPGVIAMLTGEEIRAVTKPMLGAHYFPAGVPGELKLPEGFYALAVERVRYVGEPVVAILADSRYLAEDAAELVEVDYEPLPAIVDPEAAMQPGAPLVHEGWGGNIAWHARVPGGDTAAAFKAAAHLFTQRFRCQRKSAVPLEGRGSLARYDAAQGVLTVWSTTQRPFTLRDQLTDLLDLPPGSVHVIAPPDIGGGFGTKANMRPEDLVVAAMAIRTGHPAKWVEDKAEHLLAGSQDHEQIVELQVAVDGDGRVGGMRARIISNAGCAMNTLYAGGAIQLLVGTAAMPNTYEMPSFDWEAWSVATHTAPHGAVRGFGQIPGRFAVERMMDIIGNELGIDPAEVRRRNMVRSFPHTTPTGLYYDTGSYLECLDTALETIGYDTFEAEQQAALQQGRYVGVGMASVIEVSAPNSALMAGMQMTGVASARVVVDATGMIGVFCVEAPQGQGHETVFAQVAAEQLGVHPDEVRVTTGDTALAPYSPGTFGNRAASVSANAVALAAAKVRERIITLAAHLLEAAQEDLELQRGRVQVRGAPATALTLRELAFTAHNQPLRLPNGFEPGLEAVSHFDLQCGFCTPGMLMTAVELLREHPDASEQQIRAAISGNLCRCTGYVNIVAAIASAAEPAHTEAVRSRSPDRSTTWPLEASTRRLPRSRRAARTPRCWRAGRAWCHCWACASRGRGCWST